MTFNQAGLLYSCTEAAETWDQVVEYRPARDFVFSATRLLRSLDDSADSPLWCEAAGLLRACRRLTCTVPLPFHAPELGFARSSVRLRQLADGMSGLAVSAHEELLEAIAALETLRRGSADPLGDCAREFLVLGRLDRAVLVFADRKFTVPVAESMRRRGVPVRVETYSVLRQDDVFEAAAAVGGPAWLPPWLLDAPRAENLAVVHYGFFREQVAQEPLFASAFDGAAAGRAVSRPVERARPYSVEAPASIGSAAAEGAAPLAADECSPAEEILTWLSGRGGRSGGADARDVHVEARIAVLSDGSHVLIPAAAHARVLAVDTGAEPGRRVAHLLAADLSCGDFLALRRSSHDRHVRERADALLGADGPRLREVQAAWKRQLQERVDRHARGIPGVAEDLRRRGAATANVAYWISEPCIRTRSQDDFAVVMRYLGRGEDAEAVWADLTRIDSAHRRAGHRYEADLEAALARCDVRRIAESGYDEVVLPSSHETVSVTRIDQFLPGVYQVPAYTLCSLRVSEDL
ncbi:hypothetical protein [Streptomyces sp. 7N604]|uniref:hypothetical protein n=1 Tax=Streptomyces sp. 7N604 TaxID=3457415 RepID=UPI003FD689A7